MIVEARGFVLRRNWLPVIACVFLVVGGILVARTGLATDMRGPLGMLAAFFGIMFGPVFVARGSFPRATPVAFRASPSGLTLALDGSDEIKAEDIVEAKLVPRRGLEVVVELAIREAGKKRPTKLTLRTGAREGKALLDLFGARRTQFRLVMSYLHRFLGCLAPFLVLLAVVAATSGLEPALLGLPGCAFYAALLAWPLGYLRGKLVIGADGFTTKWLFRERFIAFRDVASVTRKQRFGGGGVADTVVALAKGRRIRLRTVEAPNTEEERGTESHAMAMHMEEAFAQSARLMDGGADVPALVKRGERSDGEWLSGIDALVRGGGSRYRVAALSSEMLSEITNDPSAEVESRVGAAAALIRMGDDSLRARVRIAAEACAASELRDTLLALSEARDDFATEQALGLLRR